VNDDHKDFLDDQGKWKCIQCGACCKLNFAMYAFDNLIPQSWWDEENMQCKNLKDDKCTVFEVRPNICRFTPQSKGVTDTELAHMCAKLKRVQEMRAKYLDYKKSSCSR
jgi:Fe-S-cluster containining protein